ncbi:hypothetical protein ZIOFF_066797 [Zingiber officinale]|uniref:Uncharacterized protein n=1 Tax=Zingiber officinale TaxID=94328 RepID=A0A8J5F113_ZINOF|nr:hypothetical protein ZIOFF_066797 [Zingiber officinale]
MPIPGTLDGTIVAAAASEMVLSSNPDIFLQPITPRQTGLTLDITRNEVAMNDEMRLVNHGEPDAESLVEWFESGSLAPSSRAETDGYVAMCNMLIGLLDSAQRLSVIYRWKFMLRELFSIAPSVWRDLWRAKN